MWWCCRLQKNCTSLLLLNYAITTSYIYPHAELDTLYIFQFGLIWRMESYAWTATRQCRRKGLFTSSREIKTYILFGHLLFGFTTKNLRNDWPWGLLFRLIAPVIISVMIIPDTKIKCELTWMVDSSKYCIFYQQDNKAMISVWMCFYTNRYCLFKGVFLYKWFVSGRIKISHCSLLQ